MTKEKEDKTPKQSEPDRRVPPTGTQQTIRWDDSNMRSVYANVCHAAGSREEFVLLFGMNQSWHSGQKELKVQLTDRIVLSPFAAKRLTNLLNNVLKNYEAQYGPLEL